MSNYDEQAAALETQQQQEKGPEAFLSQEERDQVRRILSKPDEFPRELGSWVTDYVGTNAFLQKSQVQGLPLLNTQVGEALEALDAQQDALETVVAQVAAAQVVASVSRVATLQTRTTDSSPYADLATVGPSLTGLAAGTYVIFLTCNANVSTLGYTAFMSVSINGAPALDANAAISTSTTQAGAISIFTTTLPAGSSLVAKYRSLNGVIDASFSNRTMLALKIGA